MTTLVTGGLGVNGSWVVRELLSRGDDVVVVENREDYSIAEDLRGRIRFVIADVADREGLSRLLSTHPVDAIVHMAAVIGSSHDPAGTIHTNVCGVASVCQAALERGVRRVVYTSSRAVYGNIVGQHAHPDYVPITEDHPLEGVALYDVTKVAGEDIGNWFAREQGLEFVSLRFATIFGPGKSTRHKGFSAFSSLVEQSVRNEPVHIAHGGDQGDDLIYVADVATAIVAALNCPRVSAAYNIGTGRTVTLSQFADVVRDVLPHAQLHVGSGLDPMGLGVQYYGSLDSSRARTELGWQPAYDLKEAVQDYVARLQSVR